MALSNSEHLDGIIRFLGPVATIPKPKLPLLDSYFADPKYDDWDVRPAFLEIDDRVVFPVYGKNGGIAASYIFHIVGVPKGGRKSGTGLSLCFEISPGFDIDPFMDKTRAAIISALTQYATRFEELATAVDLNGGEFGFENRIKINIS